MRLIQTNFSICSVQAAILTICMMGLLSQRVGKAQDKQSDTAPQNRKVKPENPLSTDLESLEAQIADAARREAESLMGASFWDVDSNHFTHRISHTINVLEQNESGVNLIGYCLDTDGNLLTACAGKDVQEIRVFTPDGERIATWPLPIAPLQVDAAPNGQIYVAGHEVILVLDSHGKELLARDCPYLVQAKAEFEKEKARLKSEISESVEEQLRRYRSRLAELKAKYQELVDREEEQALTDSEKRRQRIYQRSITTFETLIAKQKDESWSDDIVQKLAARVRARSNVCSLAVTSSRVFLTAPGAAGFGFDIWSGNRDLTDWKIIRSGLSGCCGNMDVTVGGEKIFVAENSRFRVLVLEEEGDEQLKFGEADRNGRSGFSGCCNPMNVCVLPAHLDLTGTQHGASIYTAESGAGLIKRFDSSGKLLDHVGRVQLLSGCKNVSIAVSPEGRHVFMLDLPNSKIVVLKPSTNSEQ